MPQTLAPDTIAAIATPPGRGGIGIVRLSGPLALQVAGKLVKLTRPLEHARARFGQVLNPQLNSQLNLQLAPPSSLALPSPQPAADIKGSRDNAPLTGSLPLAASLDDAIDQASDDSIDEAIVTAFLAPQSYTGEDVVEIAAHGSPVVLEVLLTHALAHGARLAEPGEFTQRAFLAGRLDLTQAEAVHDLISARTLEQARAAAQQLGGALSRRIAPAKEDLLHLIALLEAGMDFASGELDDVDVVPPEHIAAAITAILAVLEALARSFRGGALLRAGATLALVGRPNAGKSSLFNRLLQRPRAIVTPVPGTTRDTVEESWSLDGMPIRLVDTAGLRLGNETPADEAERQGIERSREALADADLVLLVHDATLAPSAEERALATELTDRPHLLVLNKIDLLPAGLRAAPAIPVEAAGREALPVSALSGEGLDLLRTAIRQALHAGGGLPEAGSLNTRRQQESVLAAISAIQNASEANRARLPHEFLLLDLHNALQALDTLTGQTTADDILARIFSTFCIGK